jgi:hypothetical protein
MMLLNLLNSTLKLMGDIAILMDLTTKNECFIPMQASGKILKAWGNSRLHNMTGMKLIR